MGFRTWVVAKWFWKGLEICFLLLSFCISFFFGFKKKKNEANSFCFYFSNAVESIKCLFKVRWRQFINFMYTFIVWKSMPIDASLKLIAIITKLQGYLCKWGGGRRGLICVDLNPQENIFFVPSVYLELRSLFT